MPHRPAVALALAVFATCGAAPPAFAQAAEAPVAPVLKVSGYDRVRVMSNLNFDLDSGAVSDNWLFFSDIRSWLGLEAAWDRMKVVASADLAGSDFDEGAVMGFDNPARQRPFQVMMRHLYLDYSVPEIGLGATLGRQPARLGNGIVSAINRDALRFTKSLGDLGPMTKSGLAAIIARGAKGNTLWPDHVPAPPAAVTVQKGMSGGVQGASVTNDPDGSWHELDTYVLAYNAAPLGNRLQAFFVQQIDTSQAAVYPSKRYLDLNGDATFGPLKLGAEGIWLSGVGPAGASGKRPDLRSYALYGTATYTLGLLDLGLVLGRGGGDNDPTDTTNNGFQSLFIDEQSLAFNHLFGDDLHGFDGQDSGIARGSGLNNVTFVQPNVVVRFAPDLTGTISYTYHLASAAQKAGSGVLGTTATANPALTSDIGQEVDARLAWKLGATTLYGAASTFVPGEIFPKTGLANAAHKLEVGTEVRF